MAIRTANNQSLTAITSIPSAVTGGAMTLLATETASSSATIDFTSGIDSTYNEYVFKFYNIHPQTDDKHFTFQANASGGSGFNETITSSMFMANHNETNTTTQFGYETGYDQAQGTGFQALQSGGLIGNGNDECLSGTLRLFNPSSTTFVKHFIGRTNQYSSYDYSIDSFVAGYFNTTSAIDEIQFKMASGNIDAGTISLYGIN